MALKNQTMNNTLNRRNFFKKTTQISMACCGLMAASRMEAFGNLFLDGEIPNPKLLNYCGYTCPDGCEFKKASLENDPVLKKEAFDAWKINERYGIEFEADKVFCFGCKNTGKQDGVVTANCTVRTCVMEKDLECCIECDELADCDKELWSRFPKFKEKVIEMQQTYLEARN